MNESATNSQQVSPITRTTHTGPVHIAFIMDGNGRWAKSRGKMASTGHRRGVETVRSVLGMCRKHDVKIVTLFAFSSENWSRPKPEVKALMTLFASYLKSEAKKLHNDGVRVRFIGDRSRFSSSLVKQMEQVEQLTINNVETTLVLAVDYGGQWDIANAAKILAEKVQAGELTVDQINVEQMNSHISLSDLPSPDLCIRTSGEQRISNFLLWQMAYTEFYFPSTLWPDFSEKDFEHALRSYHQRDRRYGGRVDDQQSELNDSSIVQVGESA